MREVAMRLGWINGGRPSGNGATKHLHSMSPGPAFQNLHWAQRSDCVFIQRQKKKYRIGNVSTHYFYISICVDLVKIFNGTEHPFAEWNFTWQPPSRNFRMSPFILLHYQINISPEKGFSYGVRKWYFSPFSCDYNSGHSIGNFSTSETLKV